MFAESPGVIEGRGPTHVIAEQIFQFRLKGIVSLSRRIGLAQFFQGAGECLRNVPTPVVTIASAIIGDLAGRWLSSSCSVTHVVLQSSSISTFSALRGRSEPVIVRDRFAQPVKGRERPGFTVVTRVI